MLLRQTLALAFAALLSLTVFTAEALANKVEIIISKVSQKMTVKIDGETEYVWPVSTGAAKYETPSGNFRPFRMEKDHFSKEWDDAPMPHSIFFTDRGHAIHGSFYTKSLGRRASHGCVRLAPENAAKLFAIVGEAGMGNTRVVLKGGFFDFSGSSTRSLSQVGNDIDKVVKKKQSRGFFWSLGQPKKKPVVKTAKKKDVKAKKVVAAKKPAEDAKKVAAVAAKKPAAETKKAAVVAAKKTVEPPKKVAAAAVKKPESKPAKTAEKCVEKDGKKVCT